MTETITAEETTAAPRSISGVWLEDILAARIDQRDAEAIVDEISESLKAAKKRLDVASERLGRVIDGATASAEPNLFSAPAQPRAEDAPEAWRAMLIADLAPPLKPAKLKALAEHNPPILTMGDMADWQKSKGDYWIKDISGFGAGGAEQYQAAADAYWAANPLSTTDKPHTAQGGDPGSTSRGAGVERARIELGDLIDEQIVKVADGIEINNEHEVYALAILNFIGAGITTIEAVRVATLRELEAWTESVKALAGYQIRNVLKSVDAAEPVGAGK